MYDARIAAVQHFNVKPKMSERMALEMNRILLVDDDHLVLEGLRRQLSEMNVGIVGACTSGSEALARLKTRTEATHLIFLDLCMPEIDGVEFARRLASDSYAGALVLMSGYGAPMLEPTELLAREYGLNVLGCLNKPILPGELKALMDLWWGQQGSASATNDDQSFGIATGASRRKI